MMETKRLFRDSETVLESLDTAARPLERACLKALRFFGPAKINVTAT